MNGLSELRRLRALTWQLYLDACRQGEEDLARETAWELDELDRRLDTAVEATNKRLDLLYGEYRRAHEIYQRDGDPEREDDGLWLACEAARLSYNDARQAAGLRPGDVHVR